MPGLGQLYRGERSKAVGVLFVAVGMQGGMVLAIWGPPALRSGFTLVLLAIAYPFLLFPAVADAWRDSDEGRPSLLEGDSPGYVLFLLFMVGVLALPILWHSPVFSRLAKILLTILVVFIALATIVFLLYVGPMVEELIPAMLEILQGV